MSRSPASSSRGTPARRGIGRPRGSGTGHRTGSPASPGISSATAPLHSRNFFSSCLSIPVQGTKPIANSRRGNAHLSPAAAVQAKAAGPSSTASPALKRAPRKSKTDAMAALAKGDEEDGEGAADEERRIDGIAAIYGPDSDPIPVDPKLDMSSVKTRPSREQTAPKRERPFGLEDCPTYRPTPQEFSDPMAYIQKIAPEAREYGICKIVPPEGWHMPFVTDTEKFRFSTRVQKLNSIEASSRAKLNFLEQLYRYHHQVGHTRMAIPTINNKGLDLWLLRKEVEAFGGFEAVNKARKWADLGRVLGYTGVPGLSTQIKNAYTRVILPFEEFHRHVKDSPALAHISTTPRDSTLRTHAPRQSTASTSAAAGPSSPLSDDDDQLSGLSDLEEAKPQPTPSRARRLTRGSSLEQATPTKKPMSTSASGKKASAPDSDDDPSEACEVCQKNDRGEEMLLCDGCDCGFHTFCLDPPLSSVPKGQWFCHTCLFGTGGDFGFDEGQDHTLMSFQARDAEFRKLWFTSHPPKRTPNATDPIAYKYGDVVVGENDVEEEFWRLVQSPSDTVEIEYGADVHSTTHGSASPTLETHPLNSYSKDPWNLNNIPILSDSLLRYIKSDISGMTVPWTYVGMVFSTFCWHNEDHYTYSINFMHWGETKTWYGVPGDDAEKFEAAIKKEAPDLFEAQPDLLFQLVTLMNPKRLREADVRVYACNQRAGEFVITFPKAYHAGFNHGLNFNEAVNFALPDWLKYGRECIQRYREHRKHPVFSHDELLVTVTQQSQAIETALWLKDSLKEMMERERMNRKKARTLGLRDHLEEEDRPEDQYQCSVCKVFCYLSQITCGCTNHIVCADHADQLCSCNMDQRALRLRFADSELEAIYNRVEERAKQPISWQNRFNSLLLNNPRPSLRHLRALVADGERIDYALKDLPSLVKFVAQANQWVETASSFLVRKPNRARAKRTNSTIINGATADSTDKTSLTLAGLHKLLEEVETLSFDAPEIANLRAHAAAAEDIQERARELLQEDDQESPSFLKTCDSLLNDASALNVAIEEINEVEKITGAREVIRAIEIEVEKNALTLDDVSSLLTRARLYGIPQDDSRIRTLQQRQRNGQSWDERATHVLAQPFKTIEELSEFVEVDQGILINPVTYESIRRALKRATEYDEKARLWLANEAGGERPAPSEVLKLVNLVEKEFSISSIKEIKRLADFAADLESRCDQVLVNRYQHSDLDDIFDVMYKWVDYAKQHLRIFTLPRFNELDDQLTQHVRWLEHLPWRATTPGVDHGKTIYGEVMAATRPEDETPPEDEFITCICDDPVRPPAPGSLSDAVQCDHCFARFHGKCARSGGSCPFCDEHHWDGTIIRHRERHFLFYQLPSMLAFAPAITRHYSEDWRNVETIVHRIDQLITHIGQFIAYTKQTGNHRRDYMSQVRHFMRKLYKIPFAVALSQSDNFGLELAHLHRALAALPHNQRAKKRRRPKFTFGQDVDQDWLDGTRCICRGRTAYLLHYPTVRCEQCNKLYHSGCVFYPPDRPQNPAYVEYTCPLCCLRKNRPYQYAELRVRDPGNPKPNDYVDTTRMLDNFSKDIIYKTLPEPYTHTLFVELVRFIPGQPDIVVGAQGPSATAPPTSHGQRQRVALPTPAPPAAPPSAPPPPVPPPPWQQGVWVQAPIATPPTAPPPPSRSSSNVPPERGPATPPSIKRKHTEDEPQRALARDPAYSQSRPTKRRNTMDGPASEPRQGASPRITAPVPRQTPTLSPSLAMIMSPEAVHSSPSRVHVSKHSSPNGHTVVVSPVTSHPSPRGSHGSPTAISGTVHIPPATHASPGQGVTVLPYRDMSR